MILLAEYIVALAIILFVGIPMLLIAIRVIFSPVGVLAILSMGGLSLLAFLASLE